MAHFQNAATWTEQLSTSRTDSSLIKLFSQQQVLQRDANALISKFSDL